LLGLTKRTEDIYDLENKRESSPIFTDDIFSLFSLLFFYCSMFMLSLLYCGGEYCFMAYTPPQLDTQSYVRTETMAT
jgi:hypothetical protein